jgi:hypothetical protein
MIRVFYKHPNPAGGYYETEHSQPVADMAQFLARQKNGGYGIPADVLITRTETIVLTTTQGEAEFYARWGTAGEF